MLSATNVCKRFGPRVVLRGLNFTVPFGNVVAVRGANGAGKSTLLRIVAGLTMASAGMVTWAEDGNEYKGRDLGWLCGLFATDAPLPRELSVLENLRFLVKLRGLPIDEAHLMRQLERWQLVPRCNDLAGDLSSGLRARLQLAAATLCLPRVLLLDEPGANLDTEGKRLLVDEFENQRRRGVALIATNDDAEAALCDHSIDVGVRQVKAEMPMAIAV